MLPTQRPAVVIRGGAQRWAVCRPQQGQPGVADKEPCRSPAQMQVGMWPLPQSQTLPRSHKASAARPGGVSSGQGCPGLRSGGIGKFRALATSCRPPVCRLFLQPTALSSLGSLASRASLVGWFRAAGFLGTLFGAGQPLAALRSGWDPGGSLQLPNFESREGAATVSQSALQP